MTAARFLSAAEIAEELGVSETTAYRLMREMECIAVGKLLKVERASLEKWIRSHTLEARGWERRSESAGTRPLVSCDNADQGQSGATADAGDPAENPAKHGAQGRNRTADTGIFNPAADGVLPEESPETGVPCLNSVTDKAAAPERGRLVADSAPVHFERGAPAYFPPREPGEELESTGTATVTSVTPGAGLLTLAPPRPFPLSTAVAALEHCRLRAIGEVE